MGPSGDMGARPGPGGAQHWGRDGDGCSPSALCQGMEMCGSARLGPSVSLWSPVCPEVQHPICTIPTPPILAHGVRWEKWWAAHPTVGGSQEGDLLPASPLPVTIQGPRTPNPSRRTLHALSAVCSRCGAGGSRVPPQPRPRCPQDYFRTISTSIPPSRGTAARGLDPAPGRPPALPPPRSGSRTPSSAPTLPAGSAADAADLSHGSGVRSRRAPPGCSIPGAAPSRHRHPLPGLPTAPRPDPAPFSPWRRRQRPVRAVAPATQVRGEEPPAAACSPAPAADCTTKPPMAPGPPTPPGTVTSQVRGSRGRLTRCVPAGSVRGPAGLCAL